MKENKRFVVLGLGSFGTALATRLAKNGCRVTGVDASERRVDQLKHILYESVVANVTDKESLEELLVASATRSSSAWARTSRPRCWRRLRAASWAPSACWSKA